MIINKAYKFRMYPNENQKELIHKTIGCTRFLYNYMLNKKNENILLSNFDLIKQIPSLMVTYPFLKEVDSCALRCALFDLENGFKKYFAKKGGYPKFKAKGVKDGYRTNYIKNTYKEKIYENIKIDLENKKIILPKLKEVKIRGYRKLTQLKGRILNATISKVAEKYYVSVCVEEEIDRKERIPSRVVGIDVGIKSLVTTSDETTYGNPNYLTKYEKRIKRIQRELSRKIKGSKNYYKTKMKLEEIYRKLKNARIKTNEEIVSKIVKENDIIVSEDLSIKTMIKEAKKNLRKSITNSTMGDIIRRIKYKSEWLGKKYYQVSRYYASSQICSRCNHKETEMKDINRREYKCSHCGLEIDRDINASINIMIEGLFKSYQMN